MSTNDCVEMLVCWKQQRRLIPLKSNVDLHTIKQSICHIYHFQLSKHFRKYQIQFYDESFKTFVDLSSQTISRFQQHIQRLLSSDSPSKATKIWRLRIILKTVPTIASDAEDSQEDQKNMKRLTNGTTTAPLVEDVSSPDMRVDSIPEDTNHPVKLHFENDIGSTQRVQYESDTKRRTRNANSHSIGGVLLQGPEINSSGSYPKLQFEIPRMKLTATWSLHLYILTECDPKGKYYLHASKGIYDNQTPVIDRFGVILHSNLVNPYVIDLPHDNIQQGTYDVRLRVCNLPNLPTHRCEKLRKFPELNRFIMYQDADLLSAQTSDDLKFSSKKYHLGCVLVYDNRVQDRCISKLTIEDGKRTESRTRKSQ